MPNHSRVSGGTSVLTTGQISALILAPDFHINRQLNKTAGGLTIRRSGVTFKLELIMWLLSF